VKPRNVIRWRCLLCNDRHWRTGTATDWAYHYQLIHPAGTYTRLGKD
jgi:hypothetical protein